MDGVPVLVVETADGDQALTAVARRSPRLVVTVLTISGIDSLELIRRLRADPATAAIPIVVVSAAWPPPGRDNADVVGADAFLAKPIELAALAETVERLLARGEGA